MNDILVCFVVQGAALSTGIALGAIIKAVAVALLCTATVAVVSSDRFKENAEALGRSMTSMLTRLKEGIVSLFAKPTLEEIQEEQQELNDLVSQSLVQQTALICATMIAVQAHINQIKGSAVEDIPEEVPVPLEDIPEIKRSKFKVIEGGKRPDKKPDKEPNKGDIIATLIAMNKIAQEINEKVGNNKVVNPFELEEVIDLGDQLQITTADGTTYCIDKQDIPIGELKWLEQRGKESVGFDTHSIGESGTKGAAEAYTGGRTQAELEDLARDPSHAGRIEEQGIKEREVGLALEERGDLGNIVRDMQTDKGAEFIDTTTGLKWDVKSFESYPMGRNGIPITKVKKGAFSVEKGMEKIYGEFDKGNNVIIDKRLLTPEHIEQLKEAIEEAGIGDRIIWYP